MSWPSLLSADRMCLAPDARQTARHTAQERDSQPTFIRDQFEALRLSSSLPFPRFHLQENNSESRAMGKSLTTTPNQYLQPIGRTQRKNHCPSALLINYFPPQTVLWILTTDDSRRFGLKFTPKTLLLDVISFPSMTLLFPFRHVNTLMTLILKIRRISLCAT